VYELPARCCAQCHVGRAVVVCADARCGELCDVCVRTEYPHTSHCHLVRVTPVKAANPWHRDEQVALACTVCGCQPIGLPYYACCDCEARLCSACEKINDTIAREAAGDLLPVHDWTHVVAKHRQYDAAARAVKAVDDDDVAERALRLLEPNEMDWHEALRVFDTLQEVLAGHVLAQVFQGVMDRVDKRAMEKQAFLGMVALKRRLREFSAVACSGCSSQKSIVALPFAVCAPCRRAWCAVCLLETTTCPTCGNVPKQYKKSSVYITGNAT